MNYKTVFRTRCNNRTGKKNDWNNQLFELGLVIDSTGVVYANQLDLSLSLCIKSRN